MAQKLVFIAESPANAYRDDTGGHSGIHISCTVADKQEIRPGQPHITDDCLGCFDTRLNGPVFADANDVFKRARRKKLVYYSSRKPLILIC